MTENSNGRKSWTEYFRIITPFLLVVMTYIGGNINSKLDGIEQKIFSHLTNDEIHCPKSIVVTKAEFNLYQEFRQKQMIDIKDALNTRMDALRASMDRIIMLLDKKDGR